MVHEPQLKPLLEQRGLARADGPLADRRRQRGRRPRQHHRDPLPARGHRGAGGDGRRRRDRRVQARAAAATTEYDTFAGEAAAAAPGREPPVRRRAADDAAEAEYRRTGTVALQAIPATGRRVRGSGPRATARADRAPARRRAARGAGAGAAPAAARAAAAGPRPPAPDRRLARHPRRLLRGHGPARRPTVAIFRGLPYELPFGIDLYERWYTSGVTLEQVPPPAARPSPITSCDRATTPRTSCAPSSGAPRVSARNRELLALVPASLLLTAGFAALFVQHSQELSTSR